MPFLEKLPPISVLISSNHMDCPAVTSLRYSGSGEVREGVRRGVRSRVFRIGRAVRVIRWCPEERKCLVRVAVGTTGSRDSTVIRVIRVNKVIKIIRMVKIIRFI